MFGVKANAMAIAVVFATHTCARELLHSLKRLSVPCCLAIPECHFLSLAVAIMIVGRTNLDRWN
jgi:hypothetical protein